jgi:hypothetical protein
MEYNVKRLLQMEVSSEKEILILEKEEAKLA